MSIGSLQESITVTATADRERSVAPLPPAMRPSSFTPPGCGARTESAPNVLPGGARRIGGQIRAPMKTKHVSPIYPSGATGGVVILEAVIGADGRVSDVKLLRTPAPDLALSAENAVRQWEFVPTLLNCVAVPVVMTVTVQFN
jgi:TonB family protein